MSVLEYDLRKANTQSGALKISNYQQYKYQKTIKIFCKFKSLILFTIKLFQSLISFSRNPYYQRMD